MYYIHKGYNSILVILALRYPMYVLWCLGMRVFTSLVMLLVMHALGVGMFFMLHGGEVVEEVVTAGSLLPRLTLNRLLSLSHLQQPQ